MANKPDPESDLEARLRAACGVGDVRILVVADTIFRAGGAPSEQVIEFLVDLDRQFPQLSFHDFLAAVRLVDITLRQPHGSA
jgi:hypothetical protein